MAAEELEAAEREAAGVGPSLTIAGRTITFPPNVPIGIAPAVQLGRYDLVYRLLSGGDNDVLEHLILHMEADDFIQALKGYGVELGE